MSVVKDLFKLRKYNIHEVNKQIFQSQNSANQKDGKGNNPSVESVTNDKNQDISTTDMSHTDNLVVHDTGTAKPNIIVKDGQE